MSDPFFGLLRRLEQADVEFALVGGFAAAVYGCTLVTQDIDICCNFSQDNLLRLKTALEGIHPVHRMTPNRIKLDLTADNVGQFKNLYLDTDLGPLDCLSTIDGLGDFKQVLGASRLIESKGMKLHILTLDALIKAKEKLHRPHDRQAVVQLKTIRKLTENI
jgi:hypothetical protein